MGTDVLQAAGAAERLPTRPDRPAEPETDERPAAPVDKPQVKNSKPPAPAKRKKKRAGAAAADGQRSDDDGQAAPPPKRRKPLGKPASVTVGAGKGQGCVSTHAICPALRVIRRSSLRGFC